MGEVAIKENGYGALMPQDMDSKLKMAEVLAKSGLVPKGLATKEQVFLAIQWGHELGLTPMIAVNNIAVVNGRPSIMTDLMFAIAKNHKEFAGVEIEDGKDFCKVTILRKSNGRLEKYSNSYTMEDARMAGLTEKDIWKKYPKRMLKHRAMSYSCRDAFPDALAGLYTKEELEESEWVDVTPVNAHVQSESVTGELIKDRDNGKNEKESSKSEEKAAANITPAQIKAIHAIGKSKNVEIKDYIWMKYDKEINDLTVKEASETIDELNKMGKVEKSEKLDEDGFPKFD